MFQSELKSKGFASLVSGAPRFCVFNKTLQPGTPRRAVSGPHFEKHRPKEVRSGAEHFTGQCALRPRPPWGPGVLITGVLEETGA